MSTWIGAGTEQSIEQARSRDKAISRIVAKSSDISFDWFRSSFCDNNGNHDKIGRGRAVLDSTAKLDQYLYSHALMIKSQWENVLASLTIDGEQFRLIDYGCGQGLAGILLYDHFKTKLFNLCSKVILIEPSLSALVRAEAVYNGIAPSSDITCVNKLFDDVERGDLSPTKSLDSIHLFSNVLDIEGYNHIQILSKGLSPGKHIIVAVSHDRSQFGGSKRMRDLENALQGYSGPRKVTIASSEIRNFVCGNQNQSDAISWVCRLEVQ